MRILLDPNILARYADPDQPQYPIVVAATSSLIDRNDALCVRPQNLLEFYVVATRPQVHNGFEMPSRRAMAMLDQFERMFTVLDDQPTLYATWRRLVALHETKGKPAHDARLVAGMLVHGIDRILTFNVGDFQRYTEITAVDPASIVAGA